MWQFTSNNSHTFTLPCQCSFSVKFCNAFIAAVNFEISASWNVGYIFITISTYMALNIFLNGLHDCHDSHCFIMNLLQRVMQKSKNVLLPPKIPPKIPSNCIHTPISWSAGIVVTVWLLYFTPLTQCQAFVQFSQTDWLFIFFMIPKWHYSDKLQLILTDRKLK